MPDPIYKPLARIKDNTNNVIFLIRATGLENSKTLSLTTDVTGSATFDLTDNIQIACTISNGAVTHDKLATDSVQNDKILQGTIALDKLAQACFGNSDVATDNDGHIATHAQVVAYVTRLLQGYGQNYGVMSVASINAMTLDNLHNGDLVIVGGIDSEHPANVITLGNLTVRNGENLIFHKEGTGASVTGVWQSIDGEFKLIQTAVDTDSQTGSGKGGVTRTLTRLQQNSNGDIVATFADIAIPSSQITDKMSTYDGTGADKDKVVTGQAVKQAIDGHGHGFINNSGQILENGKAAISNGCSVVYTDQTNAVKKSTATFDGSSKHKALTAKGTFEEVVVGVKLEGADAPLTNINGVPTIPNAVPTGTGETNGLMTAADKKKLDDLSTGTGPKFEAIAEALNDLDARQKASEEALKEENIGDRTADSLDTQVLKIGGEEVAPSVASPEDVASSAAIGESTRYAREDHKHKISVGTGDNDGQVKVAGQNATVKGFSEVATKAGNAIQGVKVNNTALTPDGDKVVSIPTASDSQHGTVQFMTSAEAASLFTAAWNAAS